MNWFTVMAIFGGTYGFISAIAYICVADSRYSYTRLKWFYGTSLLLCCLLFAVGIGGLTT